MYMRRCNINPTKDITLQRDQSLYKTEYVLDVLWGQPIKLIQVVSASEFHEY